MLYWMNNRNDVEQTKSLTWPGSKQNWGKSRGCAQKKDGSGWLGTDEEG